ncbi:MAG: hypothetical protein DRP01_03735 [Archaeoglobales archaeon]|nr:MAG: hypothetical protein DRP01_03735 [Archaeoglobales archaeon]
MWTRNKKRLQGEFRKACNGKVVERFGKWLSPKAILADWEKWAKKKLRSSKTRRRAQMIMVEIERLKQQLPSPKSS